MVHRTMQGREVDMEKLMARNELTPAVGNANMNARGDKLGPGGKIVQTREEVVSEYYETNPKAAARAKAPEVVVPEVEEKPALVTPKAKKE